MSLDDTVHHANNSGPATQSAKAGTVQVHLRLNSADERLLRRLADVRGQTLSGAVRYLLHKEMATRAKGG